MLRPARSKRHLRGQMAVACLVLMAFILVAVMATINIGQMSQVRAETANAADAGALAGASWVASGQNEAAAVAAKMWNAIHMLQAIYAMPFCPGDDVQEYASVLWESMSQHPVDPDQEGPSEYLRNVADDVMRSAWNLGRREALTAAMNNLIVRWDAAAGTYPYPFEVGGEFPTAGSFFEIPGETMSTLVTMWQDRLYAFNIPQETIMFDWSSGNPFTSPLETGQLFQMVFYRFQYPDAPPRLGMVVSGALSQMRYLQFVAAGAADTAPVFDYTGELIGIRDTWPPTTSPIVDLAAVELPERPLEVDPDGRKYWDFELDEVIPTLDDLDIGTCEDEINGQVVFRNTDTVANVVPSQIVGGSGQVYVRVTHEVNNSLGTIADPNWGATIPVWESKFQPVASEARAQFTSAGVQEGSTQRASARLTSAN